MARPKVRYAETDMDWSPLEAIVGTGELANWMWMHCTSCADTGTDVHFYKHRWSRRYLRLDADGRVYKELRDGTPVHDLWMAIEQFERNPEEPPHLPL